ncbi:GGDEF domain-containing protein [Desulfitobacterium sp. Sab5]|uniref:GGDEF domain-containing protein n=1 Tax=Desulfitobacterium nosdiversum TaxID=3375356 RepID=UPI003CF5A361
MKRSLRYLIHSAPVILPALGVVLGSVGYYINHNLPIKYEFQAWVVITIVLIFNGIILGSIVRSLALRATLDSLTGLGNRGMFYLDLKNETHKYLKGAQSVFSLALIDVDNFKAVNDRYGHPAGDSVLRQLASIFENSIRVSDAVVRWGGEEFAIILSNTGHDGAVAFLERIRGIVEKHDFGQEVQSQPITVSVGVVSLKDLKFKKDENEIESDVVEFADKALYQAKITKNCVIAYGH